MAVRIEELAEQLGVKCIGDTDVRVERVATLLTATTGSLSFAIGPKYKQQLRNTAASAVIVPPELLRDCPVTALVSANPYLTFARAAQLLQPPVKFPAGVHASALIHQDCSIADNVCIGPNVVVQVPCSIGANVMLGPGCVITAECSIGADTRLLANVTICGPSEIGCRVLIHPGVVIGSDGFGLASDAGIWVKIPQLGRVLIGDDVEIGANTTIDRGTLSDTCIGAGVKIDNQVQIAHNVHIGPHTAIAGCVGIAGSAKIGAHCAIGGGAGIQGHIEIADGVQITGMAAIRQSITEPGTYTSGTAPEANRTWLRNALRFKELDALFKRVSKLEKNAK